MTTRNAHITVQPTTQETAIHRDFGTVTLPADWRIQRMPGGGLQAVHARTGLALQFDLSVDRPLPGVPSQTARERLSQSAVRLAWDVREDNAERAVFSYNDALPGGATHHVWVIAYETTAVTAYMRVGRAVCDHATLQTVLLEAEQIAMSAKIGESDRALLSGVSPRIPEAEPKEEKKPRAKLQAFSRHDESMLRVCRRNLRALAEQYDMTLPTDAEELDQLASAWISDEQRGSDYRAIGALGATFGQLLVDRLGFEWRLFGDAKDKVVYHAKSATCVWPFDMAIERLSAGRSDHLEMMYREIVESTPFEGRVKAK